MPFVASKATRSSRYPPVCHDSVTLSRKWNRSNSEVVDLYGVPSHFEFEPFQELPGFDTRQRNGRQAAESLQAWRRVMRRK